MKYTLEEKAFWIVEITKGAILRKISLTRVTEEIMWFSDRFFLAEQLTADILFPSEAGFNDIPKQLNHIYHFLVD